MSQSRQKTNRHKADAAAQPSHKLDEVVRGAKVFQEPVYKKEKKPIPPNLNLPSDDDISKLDPNEVFDESKTPLSVRVEKATQFFSDARYLIWKVYECKDYLCSLKENLPNVQKSKRNCNHHKQPKVCLPRNVSIQRWG